MDEPDPHSSQVLTPRVVSAGAIFLRRQGPRYVILNTPKTLPWVRVNTWSKKPIVSHSIHLPACLNRRYLWDSWRHKLYLPLPDTPLSLILRDDTALGSAIICKPGVSTIVLVWYVWQVTIIVAGPRLVSKGYPLGLTLDLFCVPPRWFYVRRRSQDKVELTD